MVYWVRVVYREGYGHGMPCPYTTLVVILPLGHNIRPSHPILLRRSRLPCPYTTLVVVLPLGHNIRPSQPILPRRSRLPCPYTVHVEPCPYTVHVEPRGHGMPCPYKCSIRSLRCTHGTACRLTWHEPFPYIRPLPGYRKDTLLNERNPCTRNSSKSLRRSVGRVSALSAT